MLKRWFLLLLCFALTGCSSVEPTYEYPASFMVETKNSFDYQPGFECAAFASAYVLRHFGEDANGLELYENFPNKVQGGGVYPEGIENFFRSKGYEAEYHSDASVEVLKSEIAKGNPVIVFIHVEVPYETTHATHYVPMVGYDEEYVYFAESLEYLANEKEQGTIYNRKTTIEMFEKLWKNIDGVWDHPYFKITKRSNNT